MEFEREIVTKDMSQYSKVYLVPLADWHLGARDCATDIIQGYIDWIANHNNALTILNGDLMNCATKTSKAELWDDLTVPDHSYKKVLEMLYPIRNKVILVTRGNHEEAIYRMAGHDFMDALARDLGVPYRPDGGMFAIQLGISNKVALFTGWATHGWGGARTIGAKVKKVEDLMMVADVDIYVLSHDHTQNIHRANILTPPRAKFSVKHTSKIRVARKILVNTGAFLAYGGYVARKGYVPQDLGTPRVRLELKWTKKDIYKDLHASL